MKEITASRYHDILYKFFITVSCLGVFILAMDIIALINHYPLYLAGRPVTGSYMVLPFIMDGLMIILSYIMSTVHKKRCKDFKWR